MRFLITVFIALGLTASLGAQRPSRQGASRSGPRPHPASTAPRTVPPPIVYPFAPLMSPPAGGLTPRGRESRTFRPNRFPQGSYGYAPFVLGSDYADAAPDNVGARTDVAGRSAGWLRLEITPATAQVFIDGLYVGTVDDVNTKRDLPLRAGAHRIELRAPYYETLVVDVQVAPNDTVTYRGTLDALRPAAPTAAQSRAAGAAVDKMYVIPNCYIGNVPPRPNRLPSGCDVKQVQVLGAK
jgi:hypothetical protein